MTYTIFMPKIQNQKQEPIEEKYGVKQNNQESDELENHQPSDKQKNAKNKTKYWKNFLINLQTISLTDKIFFVQNLRVMIKSGLSLSQALNTIGDQVTNSKFKKIINLISQDVEAGVSFATAIAKYPKVFNDLFVNMIKSGELSGNLEDVLEKLHTQMKKDHDLIAGVKGAMVYPLVVVIAMVGIGIAMIIFVVPKLITIFEEFQADLPLATKILIKTSKFITNNGLWIVIGLAIIIMAFTKFARSKPGKKILHKILLYLPVFGKISKKINLARFCRTVSSLLKTDISIVQALEITSMVVGNIYYKQALANASKKITKGLQINKILTDYPKLFPGTVIQMLKVGEESGAVDKVLDEVAQFYEEDINQVMKTLPAIIEPVLILILGLGVGAMAVAIIMPMYSLTQTF